MSISTDIESLVEMLSSKQLIVFDFDGVLADSVEIKTEVFAEIYKPFGVDVVAKVVSHHRANGGMSRFEKFKLYHREFIGQELDEHSVRGLAGKFSDLAKQAVIAAPEIPGSLEALKGFRAGGKTCAVNSATPEEEIIDIINQRSLTDFFVSVYGAPASKEKNLEKILKDSSSSVDSAVFFGDARSDFDAALALDVDFVGVGEDIRSELNASAAQYYSIVDFNDLQVYFLNS